MGDIIPSDPTREDGDKLCRRCASIDFDAAFRAELEHDTDAVVVASLGENNLDFSLGCTLCVLLDELQNTRNYDDLVDSGSYCLYAFRASNLIEDAWLKATALRSHRDNILLAVDRSKGTSTTCDFRDLLVDGFRYPDFLCEVPLPCASETVKPLIKGNVLVADSVDFGMMKEWLRHCSEHHHDQCGQRWTPKTTHESLVQVIDCQLRKVVQMPRGCNYAALSYVWGSTPTVTQDSLVGTVPVVVEDAIFATLELGLHYVWIDRYCISEDATVRHDQLRQMGSIYSGAAVTILDAAGEDATHGLAGVRGTRRNLIQSATRLRGGRTIALSSATNSHNTNRRMERLVELSRWMTRGWTYQEALLSRRRLFFTDGGAYLECGGMQCSELYSGAPQVIRQPRPTRLLVGIFTTMDHRQSVYAATRCVLEYSRRQLTYDSDALRAFLGVLRQFRHNEHPVYDYWGILIAPIQRLSLNSQERFHATNIATHSFVYGLRWSTRVPAPRRADFPSWSWAGWRAPIDYRLGLRYSTDIFGGGFPRNAPRLWAETCDGTIIEWPELDNIGALAAREMSRFVHVETWTVIVQFEAVDAEAQVVVERGLGRSESRGGRPYFPAGVMDEAEPGVGSMNGTYMALDIGDKGRALVPLSLTATGDDELRQRLLENSYEGLVFAERTQHPYILVIERRVGFAERVGIVEFFPQDLLLREQPNRRFRTFDDSSPERTPNTGIMWQHVLDAFGSLLNRQETVRLG